MKWFILLFVFSLYMLFSPILGSDSSCRANNPPSFRPEGGFGKLPRPNLVSGRLPRPNIGCHHYINGVLVNGERMNRPSQ